MSATPRLSVGLPVYNGQTYLAYSMEALLGQSFGDFELLIADNASTDETASICQHYAKLDRRIQYYRQPQNVGLAPNHNFVVEQASADLFKWASNDDLYGRDLFKLCVAALDEHPEVVLAHSWTAMIDGSDNITKAIGYPLDTSAPRAPDRFRSLLFGNGGDDDGGVVRTAVLRRTAMKESYHHADRTIIAELALHGPFYQVQDWLYFRRDHPERAERAHPSVRSRCANMDPKRADKLRNPLIRLYTEYIWAYIAMIRRAPLAPAERRECYRHLAHWALTRVHTEQRGASVIPEEMPGAVPPPSVSSVVASGIGA